MSIHEQFKKCRPFSSDEESDSSFLPLLRSLRGLISAGIKTLNFDTFRLSKNQLNELVISLVGFAEDIYNDIGLWSGYEKLNKSFFDKALPFSHEDGKTEEGLKIDRVKYFLWCFYGELKPELLIAPTHKDLNFLAEVILEFFQENSGSITGNSLVKSFLSQQNDDYTSVKNRLVWLGTSSYLFRICFLNYIEENGGEASIPLIDDFICQQCTGWSGLGATDILAEVIGITKKQKKDLLEWSEKHLAYYKINSIDGNIVKLINLINDSEYIIDDEEFAKVVKINDLIMGSLVSWNDTWHWSGQQSMLHEMNKEQIEEAKNSFLHNTPQIAYRYHESFLKKARDSVKIHNTHFKNYFKDDMVIFPDGHTMVSEIKKKDLAAYKTIMSKEEYEEFIKKHNIDKDGPDYSCSEELLESKNGIAVYHNPQEGQEIMTGFYDIVSGFEKKGKDLTEDEMEAVRMFITSQSISPGFVDIMIGKYGHESILFSFLIKDNDRKNVEYLMRRFKGLFYRKRYPMISFV